MTTVDQFTIKKNNFNNGRLDGQTNFSSKKFDEFSIPSTSSPFETRFCDDGIIPKEESKVSVVILVLLFEI